MKLLFPLLVAIVSLGCVKTDEGDTSPPPPMNAQTRLQKATQGIEQSNMTPDQKRQALEYVQRNANTAANMKNSADAAGAGTKK